MSNVDASPVPREVTTYSRRVIVISTYNVFILFIPPFLCMYASLTTGVQRSLRCGEEAGDVTHSRGQVDPQFCEK